MKKLIITITLFVLIAIGFILYNHNKNKTAALAGDEGNTALVVKGFLDEMIPHHQVAVDDSLKIATDLDITNAQVRIFAANVVDTQGFEIEKMKTIYREYLGAEYSAPAAMDHGDITEGGTVKGDDLAKAYVKNMIKHHEAAIDAAEDYVKTIDKVRKANEKSENGLTVSNSHPAVDDTYLLAKQIIEVQTKEIKTLKELY